MFTKQTFKRIPKHNRWVLLAIASGCNGLIILSLGPLDPTSLILMAITISMFTRELFDAGMGRKGGRDA